MAKYYYEVEFGLHDYFRFLSKDKHEALQFTLDEFCQTARDFLNKRLSDSSPYEYKISKTGYRLRLVKRGEEDFEDQIDISVKGPMLRVIETFDDVDEKDAKMLQLAWEAAWGDFEDAIERSNEA